MQYPALDVRGVEPGVVLAVADDFSPTAVEDLPGGLSIFFSTPARRDEAAAAIQAAFPGALLAPRAVDDEDWAQRSQANLTPITVGRITVAPPWFDHEAVGGPQPPAAGITITILPSMGFGTGHHATTRLCLSALQRLALGGTTVLDVGTGSGVLAIAAAMLGAREAVGIDFDQDAIANARENKTLNQAVGDRVRFEVADLRETSLAAADIVLANLTGAVLVQNAGSLSSAVVPGGALVVSGLQAHECEEVRRAFAGATLGWSAEEAGWVAMVFNLPVRPEV
jgi:ribosomal protein L11 methyltransferase